MTIQPLQPPRSFSYFYAAIGVILLAAYGCSVRGGNTVRVTGQLMKDGKPFTAKLEGTEPETLAIDFLGVVKEVKVNFPATVTANGTFRVDGAEGRGIPPGTYKIAVVHSGFIGTGGDRFQLRYSPEKTPLTLDLKESTKLVIDLGAGTVGK